MRLTRVLSGLLPGSTLHRWFLIPLALLTVSLGCGGDDPSKPVVVSVEPATVSVQVGQTQQFTATVTGTPDTGVAWSVDEADRGTIMPTGLYTAPATVPNPATATVRATSQADPTKSGTATVAIVAPVPLGFVRIELGMFQMGSPTSEGGDSHETQHWVRITKPLLLGEAEVTQAEYQAVMGTNPSYHQGAQRPVEQVTWFDAVNYCNALTDREPGLTRAYTVSGSTVTWNRAANGYRLPTESEWEYACRAGTTTRYWSGEAESDLARAAWYFANSGSQTHDVKGKQANAWGLYDVHGNVWEWCWDWYATYPAGSQGSPTVDPAGPVSETYRVLRGGSWDLTGTYYLRCAGRGTFYPASSYYSLGFRVARTVTP